MIDLYGVSKVYDSPPPARWPGKNGRAGPVEPRYAVKNVTLHVRRGELLVLLGGSGSGKTTTLKMINRLIEPTEGRIVVNGHDVANTNPVALRRQIGYVIQNSGLFPHMSVADNIAIVPRLLGWKPERIRARVDELLRMVGLEPVHEFRDRRPRQLSGGQQQRVGFARALAAEPPVMLLDEPFGALDPVVREQVRGDFQRLRRALGLTAVMVTHDMMEALLCADRIVVMNAGQIVGAGTPREVLAVKEGYVHELLRGPLEQTRQLETLLTDAPVGGVA